MVLSYVFQVGFWFHEIMSHFWAASHSFPPPTARGLSVASTRRFHRPSPAWEKTNESRQWLNNGGVCEMEFGMVRLIGKIDGAIFGHF